MSEKKLTDGQAIALARQIDRWNSKICDACDKLAESHPHGTAILLDLHDHGFPAVSFAELIVADNLAEPDKWEISEDRLYVWHKASKRAWETRRKGRAD